MAKATYRREHLTGDLFMVSEVYDSRINMAGRHGAGTITESWHLILEEEAYRLNLARVF